MDLENWLAQLNIKPEFVAVAICGLALVLVLYVNRRRLRIHWDEWRIQRLLGRIGSEQIRDLVCADGLDGHYRIDRLALTRNAILLVSYKSFGGNIYCAERISEWTQVIGQKSFQFENPLFELENQLTALRLLIGNVPLRGYLFFNHSAHFPKGHPESVLTPGDLPRDFLAENCETPNAEIQAAWNLLKSLRGEAATDSGIGVKT